MMTRQEMIDEAVRSVVLAPGRFNPWSLKMWRDFPESLALHILHIVRDRFSCIEAEAARSAVREAE